VTTNGGKVVDRNTGLELSVVWWGAFIGITSVLESNVVVLSGVIIIAGVAPIVCPEGLIHFVHGLFARAAL